MLDPDSKIQRKGSVTNKNPADMPANYKSDLDVHHIRRVVAGNPNTPQRVLEHLAQDNEPAIRRRTAENPHAPVELLLRLASDNHADVRLAVAENPNTPPEILAFLADDEDADVRYGVAENPKMPEIILLRLSEDENPYIRCRALKTLQILNSDVQSNIKPVKQPGYKSSLGYQ